MKRALPILAFLSIAVLLYLNWRNNPMPLLEESIQLFQKGEYHESGKYATKAVKNLRFTDSISLKREVYYQASLASVELGEFEKANRMLKKALATYQEEEQTTDVAYAKTLALLAFSNIQQAEYGQADSLLKKVLSIQQNTIGDKHPDYATSLHWAGLSKFEQRKKEKALPYYQQAKAIRATNKNLDYAISLDRLAEYHAEVEHDSLALAFCEEAMGIFGNHTYKNRVLNTLGRVHSLKGDDLKAIDFFAASAKIQEEKGLTDHPHYGLCLSNWGSACQKLGRTEEAIKYFEKANTLFESNFNEHPNYAISLNNLADIYQMQSGKEVEASKMLERSAALFLKYGHEDNYTVACINAANIQSGTNEHEKALANFQKAINSAGFKKMPKISQAASYKLYAEALWMECDPTHYTKGDSMIQRAEKIFLNNYPSTFLNYLDFVGARAEISEMRGINKQAAVFYEKSTRQMTGMLWEHYTMMNEEERLYFYDYYLSYFPTFAKSFAVRHPYGFPALYRQLMELQAAVKGASLQVSMEQRMNRSFSEDLAYNQLLEQYFSAKQKLAQSLLFPDTQRSDGGSRLDSLKAKTNQLETTISRRHSESAPSFHQQHTATSFEKIRNSLKENEVLVDFMFVEYYNPMVQKYEGDRYAALVCKKGSPAPVFIELGTAKEVADLMATNEGRQSNYIDSTALNHALYQAIWQPLEKAVGSAAIVYVCPEGPLLQLPFHVLCTDKNGEQRLIEKHNIRYRLSPGDLLEEHPTSHKKNIAVMGGIQYDEQPSPPAERLIAMRGDMTRGKESFVYLKSSKEEAEAIDQLFRQHGWNVHLTMGNEASEGHFKNSTRRGKYGIVHLATHGKYFTASTSDTKQTEGLTLGQRIRQSGEPMLRSFLVFAGADLFWNSEEQSKNGNDGILNALEVSNMDLSHTDLVVLSACETAQGDLVQQEGVFGLQRAFRLAGAKSLLVSLWPVADEPTKELMLAFYTYYIQGDTKAAALRKAQLDMSKIYQPYDWAAFVLIE